MKNTFFCFLFFISVFSSLNAQYTINSVHTNTTECDTITRGPFIIWWDTDFDYSTEANEMLDSIMSYRTYCLNELNMQDPLSVQNGFYCNIYIHDSGNPLDILGNNGWGNGVGGDSNGYPFMTLPDFVIAPNYGGTPIGRWRNFAHEVFHLFQSHGMWDVTPGIYNSDYGGWYVEATANWFSYIRYPFEAYSFVESEILLGVPQVPIWLDFYNGVPAGYPQNWQRDVHQYAMSTFFYYLTNVVDIPETDISEIFYSGTTINPQEYLFNLLGDSLFRKYFIDCAAHMHNNFDFLTPTQANNARNEWNDYAESSDNNKFIESYTNTGTYGWVRPSDDKTTTSWSFNTFKLNNSENETYTFELNGDETGNYGDNSFFQGKIVVLNSVSGSSFYDLNMSNDQQGALNITLTPQDELVYFIVGSMPEKFVDVSPNFQLFPYEVRITAQSELGIESLESNKTKIEVERYNLMGQKITQDCSGFQIVKYNDGSSKKVYIP